MKFITIRDLIRSVARRWYGTYHPERTERWSLLGIEPEKKYESLSAMDVETATAEDVADIVGNDSWTNLQCDECGESVTMVVQLGQEPDYESNTANVCIRCLGEVVKRYMSGTI